METDAEIKKFIILIPIITWTWNSGIVRQHLLKKKNIMNLFKTFSISLLLAS